jgi:hypothetical protein
MTNANVKTVNLNHGTSGSTAFFSTCPRNTVKFIKSSVLSNSAKVHSRHPLLHPLQRSAGRERSGTQHDGAFT